MQLDRTKANYECREAIIKHLNIDNDCSSKPVAPVTGVQTYILQAL